MKTKLFNKLSIPLAPDQLIKKINNYEQVIMYGIYGGGALLIDLAIYAYLVNVQNVNVISANTVSIFTAMVFSFALNSVFNFKTTDKILSRFISFAAVTGVGYLASSAILWVTTDQLGFEENLAKASTLPFVFIIQYVLNKKFTFSVTKGEEINE